MNKHVETGFKGNPRAQLNEWLKHEMKMFPGIEQLDKLLFPVSFSQIPNDVALFPYDPHTHDLLTASHPFGINSYARYSNVRIDMASRVNPNRSISFYATEGDKPAQVIQTGSTPNGINIATRLNINMEKNEDGMQPKVQLDTFIISTPDEQESVTIKLRRDPKEDKLWHHMREITPNLKDAVSIQLTEGDDEGIYYFHAKMGGKDVFLPIPKYLIPDESFPSPKS